MDHFPVDRIPRGKHPPKERPPFVPFLKLYPGETVPGILVSSRLEETETHYWCGRTVPHTEPKEGCEPCRLSWQRPRWYAFGLMQLKGGKLVIASITLAAAQSCPQLMDQNANLRGMRLILTRNKKSRQGEVSARLEQFPPVPKLCPELELWPILLNAWGVHPDFPPLKREKGESYRNRFRGDVETN